MLVENIVMSVDCGDGDALREAEKRLGRLGEGAGRIYRKSIDARRGNVKFVYSVAFGDSAGAEALPHAGTGGTPQEHRPVIVGFGPAGMFCALALARHGYEPVVFEMGADIDARVAKVDRLFRAGLIDGRTNVCFGEGGAGTFSDGKLTTRINDPLCGFVLGSFVEFGADDNILYMAKPHVGTDKIRLIAKNIREEIKRLGGEVYFNSEVTGIEPGMVTVNGADKHKAQSIFLAAGHSAFGMYDLLARRGFALEPKAYSVGFRIEHRQDYIDNIVYGRFAGHKNLPPAEYGLSHKNGRGVYSFCMCPGGVVVNAASGDGGLVTNGMSYSGRAGANANAAVCASVLPEDYGGDIQGAFGFRRRLEESAYAVRGRFAAPAQTLGDYMKGRSGGLEKSHVSPSFTGEIAEFDLNRLFPEFINESIKDGLAHFGNKLRGYLLDDAVLTAPETRTSSAVRILRNADSLEAVGMEGVYPCGEGSGYAGGIMSSAVDGIKCAIKYMQRWRGRA